MTISEIERKIKDVLSNDSGPGTVKLAALAWEIHAELLSVSDSLFRVREERDDARVEIAGLVSELNDEKAALASVSIANAAPLAHEATGQTA